MEVTTTYQPQGAVQSRVSWGALVAGAAVGVAIYAVLGLLGFAVGLSVADQTDAENLGTGAGIWAFVTLLVAMFFAGWVTTQCTVGETRTEAILYGVVVWAVTSSFLMWSAANGMALSRNELAQLRPDANSASSGLASSVGVPSTNAAGNDRNTASDTNQGNERDRDRLQVAAWWTFLGTVLSLIAAIGGAMLGPYEFVARRTTRYASAGTPENR